MSALVLIAGQTRGLVLVTHHAGKFTRVAGLKVEDWQAGAPPRKAP